MGDFSICFANLKSIYIEPDLSLVYLVSKQMWIESLN